MKKVVLKKVIQIDDKEYVLESCDYSETISEMDFIETDDDIIEFIKEDV